MVVSELVVLGVGMVDTKTKSRLLLLRCLVQAWVVYDLQQLIEEVHWTPQT